MINLSNQLKISSQYIGVEATPVLIFDNLIAQPEQLRQLAIKQQDSFSHQASDYYPGVRKNAPQSYQQLLSEQLLPVLKQFPEFSQTKQLSVTLSAFSIATTKPEQLRPIQMLPHFDTPANNQYALVHYLCDAEHGGTSFYHHKSTSFERITNMRHNQYRLVIKQEAIAAKLHQTPGYIQGSTPLFEKLYQVDAKMNRAILYPSNLLHSGNIQTQNGLSSSAAQGRLTISSFITLD